MKYLTLILTIVSVAGCQSHPKHKLDKEVPDNPTAATLSSSTSQTAAAPCDTAQWNYVYDRERLEVVELCKTVTGTITERNADPDGDEHMLLKLDKGQDNLLKKKNYKKKDGCLVVEVVCVNNITRKRAMGACTGYINKVWLPSVGDHVQVTGSYVLDSHNGWTEIHPAWAIAKTK